MAKKPTLPSDASANAAAAFADGHVDPLQPLAAPNPLLAPDPLDAVREAEKVGLMPDVLDPGAGADDGALERAEPAGFILIVCGAPNFRRGGFMHPARAEYPLNAFTQEQLDAFIAEPRLEMVAIGGEPVARAERLFGADALAPATRRDPLLAGEAAARAISDPPNRAAPGLRNAVAGATATGVAAVRR